MEPTAQEQIPAASLTSSCSNDSKALEIVLQFSTLKMGDDNSICLIELLQSLSELEYTKSSEQHVTYS